MSFSFMFVFCSIAFSLSVKCEEYTPSSSTKPGDDNLNSTLTTGDNAGQGLSGGAVAAIVIVILIVVIGGTAVFIFLYVRGRCPWQSGQSVAIENTALAGIVRNLIERVRPTRPNQAMPDEEKVLMREQSSGVVLRKFPSRYATPPYRNVSQVRASLELPTINDYLPMKTLDSVLQMSLIRLTNKLLKATPRADIKAIVALCSVSKYWNRLVSQEGNISRLNRYMAGICRPFHRSVPKPSWSRDLAKPVIGVAYNKSKIYVACKSSPEINVFDLNSKHSAKVIKFDTNDISDIVAWQAKDAIFVADQQKLRLFKIEDNGKWKSWPSRASVSAKTRDAPCALSAEKNLLLVATTNNKLKIYDTKGNKRHSIQLDGETNPYRAVLVPSGGVSVFIGLNRSALKSDGHVSKFGDVQVTHIQRKFHATFDEECCGFWCYYDKRAVMVAPQDRTRKRMLLNEEYGGLDEPGKLCFVKGKGSLLICDGNMIKMYRVRRQDIPLIHTH